MKTENIMARIFTKIAHTPILEAITLAFIYIATVGSLTFILYLIVD